MHTIRQAILFLLFVFCVHFPAQSQDRIEHFSSDITMLSDGSLQVIETIKVRSEGDKIRHGIYRRFPSVYKRADGRKIAVGLEVISLERNGVPEPYSESPSWKGKDIFLGDTDQSLAKQLHTYRFTYHTSRQMGMYSQYDELFWNLTGLGLDYPIDTVEASVQLPEGANVLRTQVFLGGYGSEETSFEGKATGENAYYVKGNQGLAPQEGFTIAISWPKGVIGMPSASQNIDFLVKYRLSLIIAVAGMLLLMFYYVAIYGILGSSKTKKDDIPLLSSPPTGVSPARARYLMRKGFDKKTFTTALVSLAVKGAIKIEEQQNSSFQIIRNQDFDGLIYPEEEQLFNRLFEKGNLLNLQAANNKVISRAIQACKSSLREENQPQYFRTNSRWLIPGILGSSILIGIMVWDFMQQGLSPYLYDIGVAIATITGFIDLIVIHIPFSVWLKSASPQGQKLMDELAGFEKYLGTQSKKGSWDALAKGEETEVFEHYLPYSIALSCAHEWGDRFNETLGFSYKPAWFKTKDSATMNANGNLASFTDKLSQTFDSVIRTASIPGT